MKASLYDLIIQPVLTEKSNAIREPKNTGKKYYTFKVRPDANKSEIIKAIGKIYNIKPLACRIINVKPKKKNRRMSAGGYTSQWKKAIITVKKEEKIEILKY